MSAIRTFRDLIVWQRSMNLARALYSATRQMPDEERFGLTSQMRLAAVSVPSNIAEGNARGSRGDYVKHLRIARGSLAELMTQYDLASLEMVARSGPMDESLAEVDRLLQGLIRSLTA